MIDELTARVAAQDARIAELEKVIGEVDKINAVTAADVKRVANATFDANNVPWILYADTVTGYAAAYAQGEHEAGIEPEPDPDAEPAGRPRRRSRQLRRLPPTLSKVRSMASFALVVSMSASVRTGRTKARGSSSATRSSLSRLRARPPGRARRRSEWTARAVRPAWRWAS